MNKNWTRAGKSTINVMIGRNRLTGAPVFVPMKLETTTKLVNIYRDDKLYASAGVQDPKDFDEDTLITIALKPLSVEL